MPNPNRLNSGMVRLAGAAMVCLLPILPATADAANREIGVTSVVNTKAEGTPPTGDTRVLDTGTKMYFEEKVVTDPTGRAQLLFADGSSMTVGPNSDLVIDTFIYNPDTKVGEMTVSLTKGLVRFVGGRISKTKAVKINTPIGSIGIRGGIAMVEMQPGQGMTADFLFGQEMTVEVGNVIQTTTTPGTFMTAGGPAGAGVSAPARREPAEINQRLKSFESQRSASPSNPQPSGPANAQTGQQQAQNQSGAGQGGGSGATPQNNQAQNPNQGLGGRAAQINTGTASLVDPASNPAGGPAIAGTPGTGDTRNASTATVAGGGATQPRLLNPVVPTPQPRPEENRPASLVPTVTVAPTPAPVPETPPLTPTVAPQPAPTPTVVVTAPAPEPEPETTQTSTVTGFSRTFAGFEFRGGTSFATTGANTTNSTANLTARRFTSATVSGADNTVGGRLTASASVGAYGLYYPKPNSDSPISLTNCPSTLNCTAQLAGVTASSATGPIDVASDPNFVVYALNVDSEKSLVVVGTEFTGSTPTTGADKYTIKPDSFLAGGIPFLRASDTGFTSTTDTDAYAKWSSTASAVPFMGSRFEIDQTNGKSSISMIAGRITKGSNPYFSGVGIGQVDTTGTATPILYRGGSYSADTSSGKDFFGVSTPDFFILNSVEDGDTGGSKAGVDDLTPATPYFPVNVVNRVGAFTINASNTQLADVTLAAYYGGAGSVAGTPGAYVATTAADTSFLSISSSSDESTITLNVSADGGSNTVTATNTGAVRVYVDDKNLASELANGATTAGAAEATATAGYVVTGGNNSANFSLCSTCAFLTWGFWGQEQVTNNVVFHMASWVAGAATNFATLGALSASGTYNGNVVGSIITSAGETLVKTGNFTLNVSLAGSGSTATLSAFNFNGNSFTTTATGFDATSQYYTLNAADAGQTLDMRGAFFGTDGANIPPETGGDFKINGTAYDAAGVFAGKK